MKQTIKSAALEVFDDKGYHKAGIRDIAQRASCAIPTIYYYYKDKETLYEHVVCESYEELTQQIADQIPVGLPLRDAWYFSVMQRRLLTDDDRRVFRLALKSFLGFDNAGRATERLRAYEQARRSDERERVLREVDDPAFARLVLRVTDQMLQSALLEDDELTQDDIRAELTLLFDAAEA